MRERPVTTRSARQRGMTLVELMLATVLAVLVMGALSVLSASLRDDSAEVETRRTLRMLRQALLVHHQAHGQWVQGPTSAALSALLEDERTFGLLEPLPVTYTRQGITVLDGFGRPVRFVEASTDGSREADFVSAGPSGRFGDPHSTDRAMRSAAMDNLYGSDTEGLRR